MKQWPWKGDSREDRAKRVALSYRNALATAAPGACAELDRHWQSLDAGWVKPSDTPLRLDDWLTANEMGELLSISPRGVYMLGYRDLIKVYERSDGQRVYRVGDVVEYHSERRKWRATREKGNRE